VKRREFILWIGGAALAAPFAAVAQRPSAPIVGYLHSSTPVDRAREVEAFRLGLKEGGYLDGKDVAIEYRWAEGRYDRLPGLATELVSRKVSVIAATSTPAALAAREATSTIPIVFSAGEDPVKLGLVASLHRPGGNVTGIANIASALDGKRIEALRDLMPSAKRIAYLANPKVPGQNSKIKDVEAAGRVIAAEIRVFNASTEAEIESAFAAIAQSRPDGLLVSNDAYFFTRRDQIVALAARFAVPTCYPFREFAIAGGLMSLGPDLNRASREQGRYTARVLNGTKPADLPVFQAEKFELIVNRKTVKKLGLTVSRNFLDRVNEIVE